MPKRKEPMRHQGDPPLPSKPESTPPNTSGSFKSTAVADLDDAFMKYLRGPEGADLRRAHLLEQLTAKLFGGDAERARTSFDAAWPELEGRSPAEAALTHEGMLQVLGIIGLHEERARTRPKVRGLGAFLEAIEEGRRGAYEPLLDLLPAAWGLTDGEFELLLGRPPPSLTDWRRRNVALDEALCTRLSRLRRLQAAIRSMVKPQNYAQLWRFVMERGGPLGERSLWQAFVEDGDRALDCIEEHYRRLAADPSL